MALALLVNFHLVPNFGSRVRSLAVCSLFGLDLLLLSLPCVTLGKSLYRALKDLSGAKHG